MTPKPIIQSQMCFLLTLLPASLKAMASQANATPPIIAKPGCRNSRGKVSIPFPFGIGVDCFLDPWFEIDCNPSPTNSSSSNPFLSKLKLEVLEIFMTSNNFYNSKGVKVRMPPLKVCAAQAKLQHQRSLDLSGSLYTFSNENVFAMKGCAGNAVALDQYNKIIAGCATVCQNNNQEMPTNNRSCYGVQCCGTTVSSEFGSSYYYEIDFNLQPSGEAHNCLVASLMEYRSMHQFVTKMSSLESPSLAPVILSWRWPYDFHGPHKHPHATCSRTGSLHCFCDISYDGNPYISYGCQGPEECKNCRGSCLSQLNGSGIAIPNKYYCENKPLLHVGAILGPSIGFGLLLLAACLYGLYRFIKRQTEMKRRSIFFKRNGGLLLQQQLSANEGIAEGTKVFNITELNKATNYFNENRILGQGGQGTVYKGMLNDGSIVAIKKSKLVDESQLEQFINEVVILSRVNHRHVVKLFGCCLETEVPLLVY